MSQPAVRSVAHATASAATQVVCNAPAGAQPGDIFIAVVATTANTAINVTAVANLTWSRISSQTNNGVGFTITVFAHRVSSVGGREPATWTFNDGATSTAWAVSIVCYSAMDFFAKTASATTTGSGTTQNSPSQTNTNNANLISVACVGTASNSTFSSPPAGYFIEDQVANATGISVCIFDSQIAAPFPSGTGTLAITTSGTGVGAGIGSTWTPNDLQIQLNASKAVITL
jgi:hypothetical protein